MWALESAKYLNPRENPSFSYLAKAMAEDTAVLRSSIPFSTFAQATDWGCAHAAISIPSPAYDTGGSTGF